jgi:hypothetical protein
MNYKIVKVSFCNLGGEPATRENLFHIVNLGYIPTYLNKFTLVKHLLKNVKQTENIT